MHYWEKGVWCAWGGVAMGKFAPWGICLQLHPLSHALTKDFTFSLSNIILIYIYIYVCVLVFPIFNTHPLLCIDLVSSSCGSLINCEVVRPAILVLPRVAKWSKTRTNCPLELCNGQIKKKRIEKQANKSYDSKFSVQIFIVKLKVKKKRFYPWLTDWLI